MIDIKDLYEHPHDRGELTAMDVAQLRADWERSPYLDTPEGLRQFVENTKPWCDIPMYYYINTAAAYEEVSEV